MLSLLKIMLRSAVTKAKINNKKEQKKTKHHVIVITKVLCRQFFMFTDNTNTLKAIHES